MGYELTVRVIGSLSVSRNGEVLAGTDVGSRKARLLLALLAVQQRHRITVDRIADALWGDTPPRSAQANVATLVSRLRATFGRAIVAGNRRAYRLGDHVRVDLYEAEAMIAAAESTSDAGPTRSAAQWAVTMLDAADVLDDLPDATWAEPARMHRTALLRRGRVTAADAALLAGDVGMARDLAERAMAADAFDEAACRAVMRAHDANGEPARALIAYHRLCGTLAAELGIRPAAATRDLQAAILLRASSTSTAALTRTG